MEENNLFKIGKILELFVAIFLICVGMIFRFLPHPPNFTPIGAISLFAGSYLSRKIALILPLIVMGISDLFLGLYSLPLMFFVYFSFLLCVFLGFRLKNQRKLPNVFGYSLLGSVLFYLLTNFAVWAFTNWYPKNLYGLVQSYIMALPFFKNTLTGDLFYTSLFFGAYEAVGLWIRSKFKVPKKVSINTTEV